MAAEVVTLAVAVVVLTEAEAADFTAVAGAAITAPAAVIPAAAKCAAEKAWAPVEAWAQDAAPALAVAQNLVAACRPMADLPTFVPPLMMVNGTLSAAQVPRTRPPVPAQRIPT
jgi:hypothetical protein